MLLNNYMNTNFPALELRPPLFYSWDIGIRFELGVNWEREYDYPDNPYILGCYHRAISLFKALHSPEEDIYVVMDISDFHKRRNIRRNLGNFSSYVEKFLLYRLSHEIKDYVFPEDDEAGIYKTHRFTLKCKAADLNYIPLLKAICNQDLALKPSIYHRVYFINIDRKTIFHVYDDRGCDLLAESPENIRSIYKTFNDWILDYDWNMIDKVFK